MIKSIRTESLKAKKGMFKDSEINMESYESALDHMVNKNPIPAEILNEIRAGYHSSTRTIKFILNQGLFTDLYLFAVARLKVYYEQFKQSGPPFRALEREMIEQEVLYEILKRHDLL